MSNQFTDFYELHTIKQGHSVSAVGITINGEYYAFVKPDELARLREIEERLTAKIERLKEDYDPRLVYLDDIRLALIEEFVKIRDGSGD